MRTNEISLEDARHDNPSVEDVNPFLAGLPTTARWYIDVRDWEANGKNLPLLESLRPDEQKAVTRYYHAADKRMSLASHLLKYLYIHHACGVPWKEIILRRTDLPENRPYYKSTSDTQVEFNVTHQAGLTMLAGTIAPNSEQMQKHSTRGTLPEQPRLGIDVTCVNENRRRVIKTMPEYLEHVSIFVDVFSDRELETMKNPAAALRQARALGLAKAFDGSNTEETIVNFGVRLFYSYWALKEAYLKMTGDALLAPWLRTLEFSNVVPPTLSILYMLRNPMFNLKIRKISRNHPKTGALHLMVSRSRRQGEHLMTFVFNLSHSSLITLLRLLVGVSLLVFSRK